MSQADADNAKELFEAALDTDWTEADVDVAVAKPVDDAIIPSFRRLKLDADAAKHTAVLGNAIFDILSGERDFDQVEYVPARPFSHPETHKIPFRKISVDRFLRPQVDAIKASFAPKSGTFDIRNDEHRKGVRFYAHRLVAEETDIIFLAKCSSQTLKAIPRWGLFYEDKVFHTRDSERIFVFSEHPDCIVVDDYLFVFKQSGYEYIFENTELMRRISTKAFTTIERAFPMTESKIFLNYITEKPSRMRVAVSAADRRMLKEPPEDLMETLEELVENEPEWKWGLEFEDGKIRSRPKDCPKIFKLLKETKARNILSGERLSTESYHEISD